MVGGLGSMGPAIIPIVPIPPHSTLIYWPRMKILTAAQMRDVDRITIQELGMPSLILMENAGARFVEALEARFAPLDQQRIAILCGKGNNGGDGFVIARQLWMRHGIHPRVVLLADPEHLSPDAAANHHYLTKI